MNIARFTLFVVLSTCFLVPTAISGMVPIPARPEGLELSGQGNSSIVIEAYLDLLCPYSAQSYPALLGLTQHYTNQELQIRIHLFPLPYHTFSFVVNSGAHFIQSLPQYTAGVIQNSVNEKVSDGSNADKLVFKYIQLMFDVQEKYSGKAAEDLAYNKVVALIANDMEAAGLCKASTMSDGLRSSKVNDLQRVQWKVGCSRGIAGTPSFFINGVLVDDIEPDWKLDQWKKLIDPLLKAGSSRSVLIDTIMVPSIAESLANESCHAEKGAALCEYLPGKFDCCKEGQSCKPNTGCRE